MKPELINVVKQLRKLTQRQDQYIESLPREFQEVVQDNEYTNCASMQTDVVLKELFGSEMYEDVCWFLYEFTPGKSPGPHIIVNGTEYFLLSDDDYYEYLKYQDE